MFRTLALKGVKGLLFKQFALQPVTIFCGPHGSGKTAVMESACMAATGECSFGASNAKMSELVESEAYSQLDGDEFVCTSEIKKLTRCTVTHTIEDKTGCVHHVDSILCKLPCFSEQLWELSEEDKWKAIESVVGKFCDPEPPPIEPVVQAIAALKNAPKPEAYNGPPVKPLQEELALLNAKIDKHAKSRAIDGMRKSKVATHQAEIESCQNKIAEHLSFISKHEARINELNRDLELFANLNALQLSIDYEKTSGDSILALLNEASDIVQIAASTPRIREVMQQYLDYATSLIQSGVFNNKPPKTEQIQAAILVAEKHRVSLQDCPNYLNSTIYSCMQVIDLQKAAIEALRNQISSLSLMIREIESESESIDIAAVHARRSEILPLVEKGTAWVAWFDGHQKRVEKIQSLENELAQLKSKWIVWKNKRSEWLVNGLVSIELSINATLAKLNFEPVKLSVVQHGSKQSLSISGSLGAKTVNAMSGAQRAVVSTLLLNELQMRSRAKCPVLFVESSEMSPDLTGKLADELALLRTKGNVFIAHYGSVYVSNSSATVHVLS